MKLNPSATALVSIHCQGDIIGPDGGFAQMFHEQIVARDVVGKIGQLQAASRRANVPVIYTRIAWASDYSDMQADGPLLQAVVQADCLKEGQEQTEFVDALAPQPEDTVITHQRIGGFTAELASALEENAVETVLFCGVATNISVESTMRAANDAGFHVALVEDACSAASPEAHQASVESLGLFGDITTVDEVQRALGAA